MKFRPRLAAFAALALGLAGCGNSRTPVPDPSVPVAPAAFHDLTYRTAGAAISAPTNWIVTQSKAPLVAIVSSGDAIVALWRFPRSAAVPLTGIDLRQALSALVTLSRRRDPSLQVIRTRTLRFARAPAVEVDAFQHIGGQLRRVRSLHMFVAGAEVVLEQYAPPASFHTVDHEVFSPMRRSLRLLRARQVPARLPPRAFVIVPDACGVGELADSATYGDSGANTLGPLAALTSGLRLPTLERLGLGCILPLAGVAPSPAPAIHGRPHARGAEKDSTAGHWELMGVVNPLPLPTSVWYSPTDRDRPDGPLSDVGASVLHWLTGRSAALPGRSFLPRAPQPEAAGAQRVHRSTSATQVPRA